MRERARYLRHTKKTREIERRKKKEKSNLLRVRVGLLLSYYCHRQGSYIYIYGDCMRCVERKKKEKRRRKNNSA